MMRKELIGDNKVNVCDMTIDSLEIAQTLAAAKTLQDNDDSFYVVNLDAVYERHLLWKKELPNVEPFYAVKCNSDVVLLNALASLGVNFDCASREEIDTVLSIGVDTERVIYANPCKTRSFIKHAEQVGVTMMTFDNKEELEKIAACHKMPQLILRIAVSDPTATCPLNLKFGAEPTKIAPELLYAASRLGINVRGISFHVGSGCNDPAAYHKALEYARGLFDLGASLGMHMDIVDIGGGFPGGEHRLSFEKIASVLRPALDAFFPVDSGVRVIGEPGRFYAARPFTLVANVTTATETTAAKITKKASDGDKKAFMYYINDGVYGSFNCILFDHVHPTGRPLFDVAGAPEYPCTIWGPTCDSLDLIEEAKQMRQLSVGDWMVYEEMGAYTCAASTTFNGFARPTPVYFISQRAWLKFGF